MRSNDDIDDDMEKEEEEAEEEEVEERKIDGVEWWISSSKTPVSRGGYQLSIHKLSVKPQQLSLPSLTSYCRRAPTLVVVVSRPQSGQRNPKSTDRSTDR